jgi:CDP-paratose 2-epimerase
VESSREERPYDLAWVVLDATRVQQAWAWKPQTSIEEVLEKIASHARANPRWLEMCEAM